MCVNNNNNNNNNNDNDNNNQNNNNNNNNNNDNQPDLRGHEGHRGLGRAPALPRLPHQPVSAAEVEGGHQAAGVGAAHDEDGGHLVPHKVTARLVTNVITRGCQEAGNVVQEPKGDNHNGAILDIILLMLPHLCRGTRPQPVLEFSGEQLQRPPLDHNV